jgi:hypothetical protein
MTDKIEDGGPAFPIETTATPYAPGMSLRDWFAGQALCGLMANDEQAPESVFAKEAYRMADAMIAARNAK